LMEKLLELAVTSFIVGLTGAMMPGPVLIATILQSTKKGYVAGPLVTLGHAVAELILTVFLIRALAFIVGSLEFRVILGLIGGTTLLWMGSEALRYSKEATIHGLVANTSRSKLLVRGPVSLGLLMSVSNPYWWVWWGTLGNAFLIESLAVAGVIGAATFYFSHIMSDFAWYTAVSSSIGKGRTVISDKAYRYILAICGLSLLVLGVIFIVDGMTFILALSS
jgi:threonine/homoserine/homoserine lactone efflux protein